MIYVISDTHIPERASQLPPKFVEKIKKDDLIFHAGDFTQLKVYQYLEGITSLNAVYGNMDQPELKKILPARKTLELSGFKIGLIHGSGSPFRLIDKVKSEFTEELNLIIFGHSHNPYNQKHGKTLLFNPGSLSGNLLSGEKSYGILHVDEGKIWAEVIYIK